MKLHELYTEILKSISQVVDENGLVSTRITDSQLIPTQVGQKRLVVPTPEMLKAGEFNERGLQPYHPLSEKLDRGESEVVRLTRYLMIGVLAEQYTTLVLGMANVCATPALHKKLSTKAHSLLRTMPDADEKTVAALGSLVDEGDDVRHLVNIYTRRGAMWEGRKVPRVAYVRFPLAEMFSEDSNEDDIPVKLRKKDIKGIRKLLSYITPDFENRDTYAAGSTSVIAPTFQSIVLAYVKVIRRFNLLLKLLSNVIPDAKSQIVNLDWFPYFEELDSYRDVIPPLAGNEGEIQTEESAGLNKGAVIVDGTPRRSAMTRIPAVEKRGGEVPPTPPALVETKSAEEERLDRASQAIRESRMPQYPQPHPPHPPVATPAPESSGNGSTMAELMRRRQQNLGQNAIPPPAPLPGQAYPPQQYYPPVPPQYEGAQYTQPGQPIQQPYYPQQGYPQPQSQYYGQPQPAPAYGYAQPNYGYGSYYAPPVGHMGI